MLRTAVERPVATAMVFLGLMLIGVVSISRIPVDLLPDINYPRLTAVTRYSDIQAEDIERLVTIPLEAAVTSLPRVRRVESRSREGLSVITVEYEWGADMNFAALRLREALDRVAFRSDFPENAERPLILRWDPTSRPISILVLQADKPLREVTEFATDVAKPALEQIQGLSQAEVIGGVTREIRIEPDPEKMRVYNLTIRDIARALQTANVSFPGGQVRAGPLHLSLRIIGEFEDLSQIEATAIARPGGRPLRIGEVATVRDDVKEPEGATLFHGREVVSFLLYKETGANTVRVSRDVDRILELLGGQYPDFKYIYIYQDAGFIKDSLSGLVQSLIIGALLAFLVLFLFLSDLRSPVVIGIAIPVSIMVTFAMLYLGKVNLNIMSLGGLSLAAGMLVDNAIVVLENINRHIQESRGRRVFGGSAASAPTVSPVDIREHAIHGSRQVGAAVAASTFTTVAVFLPVVYVPGVAGEFFRDQALTVTFSLLVSLVAALWLQPSLAARLLSAAMPTPRGIFRSFTRGVDATYHAYHRVLVRALDHKRIAFAALIALLVVCVAVGMTLPRDFLPARSTGDLSLLLELPAGMPLADTRATAERIVAELESLPQVQTAFLQVGVTQRTLAAVREYTASHTAEVRIILRRGRSGGRDVAAMKDHMNAYLASLPAVLHAFRDEGIGLREILGSSGAQFTLGIMAEQPETALSAADQVTAALANIPGLVDLKTDRVLGTPNLVLRVEREEALRSGLDPEFLGDELRNRIQGVAATTFNEADQRIDIAVRFPESERKNLAAILDTPVEVGPGRRVRLGRFVTLREEIPVRELTRRDQRRLLTISGDVRDRRADHVQRDAVEAANALALPPGARLVATGEQEEVRRSFSELGFALLLAIVIVYMILAGTFESFLDPLLIASVVPMGLAGSVLVLAIFRQSVNVLSIIGLIALIGVGVNDAIVKLDAIRQLRQAKMEMRAALLEASRTRFRPIVMNTLTAVIGVVPMAIGIGGGEQLQRPLALTIIGGLTFSTVLTLIYTPVLYEWAHRREVRASGVTAER